MELVLCKDCKHSFRTWYDILFGASKRYSMKCRLNYKSSEEDLDLVTGPKMVDAKYESCSLTRLNSQPCGESGKLWQPKHQKDIFKYIKHVAN